MTGGELWGSVLAGRMVHLLTVVLAAAMVSAGVLVHGAEGVGAGDDSVPVFLDADHWVWEFGELSVGDVARHEFSLTNKSRSTVNIVNVRSTCGCLEAVVSRQRIEPGQSASITVVLDTTRPRPAGSTSVFVETDPQAARLVRFQVGYTVQPRPRATIEVAPRNTDLGLLLPGERRRVRIRVRNVGGMPLTVAGSTVGSTKSGMSWVGAAPGFPIVLEPGQESEMQVLFEAPTGRGIFQRSASFASNDPQLPTAFFAASGYVATPDEIRRAFERLPVSAP